MSDAAPGPEVAPPLWQRICTAPQLSDGRRAGSRLAEFLEWSEDAELQKLAGQPNVRALLLALADHSPFLWRLATADVPRLGRCLASDPETVLAACLATCEKAEASAGSDAAIMRALRLAKQESALLIALADLGGAFDVIATTGALSRAADTFISVALRHVLREAGRAGRLRLADGDDIETGCGLVILALGKLGARELNYSSDVDIVVFFDPECASITGTVDPATLFSRLTKGIVRLLQERTPDGYVERVDLRLRPDPGSTAVAIALPTAYSYYESLGQNWERAAFIKARPVAGNKALGETFLANLMPFIWRKYFDYAAIADIAAMKRQIHASRGHGEIAVAGHDVKLGRGGIREIEFFVQTQQLIFGGKRPRLRGSRTLDMLEQLGNEGWVTQDAVADLRASYLFLREIEHRLQMVDDEQTQRLPSDEDTLGRFARFCGYAQKRRFCSEVTHRLRLVSHHYERLFEHSPRLDVAAGSLVFTGATEDPETLETLLRLGFKQAALAVETIRGWHFGRRPAVRGARAREILTELVPLLLQAFSRSGDPDAALAGLDAALAGMPAAAELFLVLKSNPPICELFGEILGGAPRLARTIISHPHVLDAAIDPDVLRAPLDEDAFSQRASQILRHKFETEEFLDALRDFAQEELFPIGLRLWSGMIEPSGAALAYSALAASIVETALAHVERDFSREHGKVPGGRLTVLALGKLGSREMTAASDLDLILIYDFDAARPESEGSRPLHAVQYYTRLVQRLISALTVATRRGRLYDVDMRLRPSGGKGPLATQYSSFAGYQATEAETWEHMVLTRARPVAGDKALGVQTCDAIRAVLTRQRGDGLRKDVHDMRRLIAKEKGEQDPWDLKLAAGGLIDIEFLAQYLLLRHAHAEPSLVCVSPLAVIEAAARIGKLNAEDARCVTSAYRLLTDVTQILRLTLDMGTSPREANEAVRRRLSRAAGEPDLSALESRLSDTRADVRAVFDKILLAR
ncbi:bifunctional [glutamine synthetase] adenylyltransferase/[glutamine synthetase]-adenylyl-L-tyrosine phosphorylase [Methylocapsa sp. D3K7]|uniref:bifunctional [glutamine synthetase] adenylyltransferase/[glutamine synthetase]-adenylyl-L-tyrosine phosphorylase n=1 Tax=Methylocapsa sp. D3K7 TaxID=3041435 RepID=UPI00244E9767|nr:bifunctional [glutamine synthetase] adenylyltransferase/[glutamine synthetase]-adenylyl-L-tyrosine phosphorylase [Methylocapsa sp. D3K7]WGJ13647.1 bifunctional [glutamine synthetase] adenylyltransferase/[glutamine synthetase]-adenylyl-L-tyrosine phosphorylase [Methylocapsa sp. D3K7]